MHEGHPSAFAMHTGTGCLDASGAGPGPAVDGRAGQRQVLCRARRHSWPAQQWGPLHLCSSGTEVQASPPFLTIGASHSLSQHFSRCCCTWPRQHV